MRFSDIGHALLTGICDKSPRHFSNVLTNATAIPRSAAKWLKKTAVRSHRTGRGRDAAGRQGGTRRSAGPLPKAAGWSAP